MAEQAQGARHNYLPVYSFEVCAGRDTLGFKSIKGIKLSVALEPIVVGGVNTGPAWVPSPVKETGRLTMERGVLPMGRMKTLVPGELLAPELQIHILNQSGKRSVSYSVAAPIVESVELSGLDALEGGVLIESLVIAHCGIEKL